MLHLGIFLAATGASRTDSLNVDIPKGQRAVEGGQGRREVKRPWGIQTDSSSEIVQQKVPSSY